VGDREPTRKGLEFVPIAAAVVANCWRSRRGPGRVRRARDHPRGRLVMSELGEHAVAGRRGCRPTRGAIHRRSSIAPGMGEVRYLCCDTPDPPCCSPPRLHPRRWL